MQENNRINEPIIIITITLITLLVLSFIKFEYMIESANLLIHNVDMISDLRVDPDEANLDDGKFKQPEQKINYANKTNASVKSLFDDSGVINSMPDLSTVNYLLAFKGFDFFNDKYNYNCVGLLSAPLL